MKLNGLTLTAAMSALLLVGGGCEKSTDNDGDGRTTGRLVMQLAADNNITDITRSKVSDITAMPAVDDFTVTVKKQDDNSTAWTGKHSDVPADGVVLPVGYYLVSAYYGSRTDEGFDKPYFTTAGDGVKCTIHGDRESVTLPVKLGNTVIKVATTEAFDKYFTDYTFTVTTGAGNKIAFPKGETRGAFIEDYQFSISGTLTNQSGKQQTFTGKSYTSLNPATCYTVTFDTGGTGGATVTITINGNFEEVNLGDIELNED